MFEAIFDKSAAKRIFVKSNLPIFAVLIKREEIRAILQLFGFEREQESFKSIECSGYYDFLTVGTFARSSKGVRTRMF